MMSVKLSIYLKNVKKPIKVELSIRKYSDSFSKMLMNSDDKFINLDDMIIINKDEIVYVDIEKK